MYSIVAHSHKNGHSILFMSLDVYNVVCIVHTTVLSKYSTVFFFVILMKWYTDTRSACVYKFGHNNDAHQHLMGAIGK